MLTRRTNILFDDELYRLLEKEAEVQNKSIGHLVRSAVRNTFLTPRQSEVRMKAIAKIRELRPSPEATDYRSLIAYGRKDR